MKLLVVEDDESTISAFESELPLFHGCNVIFARSRHSAEVALRAHEFDLVVLDLKLPAQDKSLDSDINHGLDIHAVIQEVAPGTPVIVFSGHGTVKIASRLSESAARHDIWGCGTVSAMTVVREKSELADCLAQIGAVLDHVTALAAIEVSTGGRNLGLTDHHKRILRIFSRLNRGVNVRVSPLGGGLSDAKTLLIAVQDQHSNVTSIAVAKLGRINLIMDEEVRYNHCIAPSLGIGAFAHFIRFIRAGAADIGGIFYAFAQDYSRTLLDVLRDDPAIAAKIVGELIRMESIWQANAVNRTMTVGDIRRTLIKDDAFHPLASTLGFDWQRLEALQVRVRWCCQHRDLHGLNVLLGDDGTPIFIDYGEVEPAPACLDPLIMELSLLFHPGCKVVCGVWPTEAQASQWTSVDVFSQDTPLAPFIKACRAWAFKVESQDNGVYATVYAYAVRQLKFPDTNHALAIAVAKAAATPILNS